MYFLGRGCVWIGTRSAAGAFEAIEEFHCPEFEIDGGEVEYIDHFNTCEAIAQRDLHIATKFQPKVAFKIDTFTPKLVAAALGGEVTEVPTGNSFSAKAFPTVAVNKSYPVPGGYSNLESLTITDSNGTPATLTANTHYTVDLVTGIVTFINLASYTQPFKAAGSEADDFNVVSIATRSDVEKYIRFAGINIADPTNPPMNVDIYRASFDASKFMPKSSGNEVFQFDFNPMLLKDPYSPFTGTFGDYGRILIG